MYRAIDIAMYIIEYGRANNKHINNLKLQKVLYFLWIEFYRKTKKSLFSEDFVAWHYGPVIPEIYYEFSHFGASPIYVYRSDSEISIDSMTESIITEILSKLLKYESHTLIRESLRSGGAWEYIFMEFGSKMRIPRRKIIELEVN